MQAAMKIGDLMRRGVISIEESTCLGDAYTTMNRSEIRHLPVTRDGAVVGMLSERDLLSTRAHHRDWWEIPASAAMHTPIRTASPEDSVDSVVERMAREKLGAMPIVVVDTLVGIVTVIDLLQPAARPTPASSARDAMTPFPFTVGPEASLLDAVSKMVDHRIRHLPVVDRTGALVGILSERDIRTAIGDPVRYREMRGSITRHSVGDVMAMPAIQIPFDRPLGELARRFAEDRLEAVCIVDKFGALIGIVSYVDVLRVLGTRT
jgi:CBS domain-containing protein